jgi:uncharacterized protein (TIGR03000 family)
MIARTLSVFAALCAAAALGLSPGTAEARGGGGGGHGGGGHGGGMHGGGGNYHGSSFHGGRFFGGGVGFGWGYPGYGYGSYWPGTTVYDYAPSYYGGSYYGSYPYYESYPSYPSATDYSSGGTPSYYQMPYANGLTPLGAYGASGQPAPIPDDTAHIRVTVAEGAKVWFDGAATQQDGTVRDFVSPPLRPGHEYTYDIKVNWRDKDGKEVTRTRQVDVRSGSQAAVDFTR